MIEMNAKLVFCSILTLHSVGPHEKHVVGELLDDQVQTQVISLKI